MTPERIRKRLRDLKSIWWSPTSNATVAERATARKMYRELLSRHSTSSQRSPHEVTAKMRIRRL